ncbi:ECF transporter S component [Lactobacillus acetotolerans]|nr:ECF transporter S component [Lactobacillus acetotolerans]
MKILQHTKIKRLVLYSLFFAILLIQEFVPFLGNIPIGPISLTIIDITLFTAALEMGPTGGAIVGGFWGIVTLIRAFTVPSSPVDPIIFTNPLISVLPKIVMGWLCPWLFLKLKAHFKVYSSMIVSIVLTEIVTAILTLGPIYLFYATPKVEAALGVNFNNSFAKVIGTVVVTNAFPETILAAVIVPMIVTQLFRKFKNQFYVK